MRRSWMPAAPWDPRLLTVLLFWLHPPVNPWLGIPLCVGVFSGSSWLLGLMHRRDLEALYDLVRKPRDGAAYPFEPPG